jgi:intracellular multiplication protein IcmE
MLNSAIPKKASFFARRGLWSGAGRAGPRRLLLIGVSGLAFAAVVVGVTLDGKSKPIVSYDARMQAVDANPGGLNSDQEQNALARRANDVAANAALAKGVSYTPPIAPSVPTVLDTPAPPPSPASAAPLPAEHFPPRVPSPAAPPSMIQPVDAPVFPPPLANTAAEPPPGVQTADDGGVSDPQQQSAYTAAINGLFNQWNGKPPVTDVVLPPPRSQSSSSPAASGVTSDPGGAAQSGSNTGQSASDAGDPDEAAANEHVIIPAGRGIFAHPVLALSSDETSPVVLQADSGPIAGDRMIGSFARENDRLIINISQIIHNGQAIGCSGVVIAPDTMEAAVASGVDQHYIARFLLPAAAAFIQGLGNAIATTSNSTQVLSPFGGATTTTNLNFHQQLGVAAGVAAAQVGSTLDQDAPKGPTITLAANVAVGVMFLSDVKVPDGP